MTTVRWGIVGTANIARRLFLPAVRQAGGEVSAVAGRDAARTARWAHDNGIGRAVTGYAGLIGDPEVDALYIPLPNTLHGQWTISALRAGRCCARNRSPARWRRPSRCSRWRGRPARHCGKRSCSRSRTRWNGSAACSTTAPSATCGRSSRASISCSPGGRATSGCRRTWRAGRCSTSAATRSGSPGMRSAPSTPAPGRPPTGTRAALTWPPGEPSGSPAAAACCCRAASTGQRTRSAGCWGPPGRSTSPTRSIPASRTGSRSAWRAVSPSPTPGTSAGQHPFTAAVRHIQAVVRGEEEPRLLAVDTSLGSARALHDLAASATAQRAGQQAGQQA